MLDLAGSAARLNPQERAATADIDKRTPPSRKRGHQSISEHSASGEDRDADGTNDIIGDATDGPAQHTHSNCKHNASQGQAGCQEHWHHAVTAFAETDGKMCKDTEPIFSRAPRQPQHCRGNFVKAYLCGMPPSLSSNLILSCAICKRSPCCTALCAWYSAAALNFYGISIR